MRYIILVLAFLVSMPFCVFAQSEDRKLTISGQLHDVELKEPVSQATIQLFLVTEDSTFVGGTISNEKGIFSVEQK